MNLRGALRHAPFFLQMHAISYTEAAYPAYIHWIRSLHHVLLVGERGRNHKQDKTEVTDLQLWRIKKQILSLV